MKRFYVDGPFGQVHCRSWGDDRSASPIICLAPAPFSSKAYITLAPLLAEKRRVIAVDYPGYGESDLTENEPSISDFAKAVLAVVEHCSNSDMVDLLGFHSGCLVATELAVLSPEHVNHLLLVDVPFFSPEKQAELLLVMPEVLSLLPQLNTLEKTWNFCITTKRDHIEFQRAYQMFVDHISSGELGNRAFRAAFTYECEERFKLVEANTSLFATDSTLKQLTHNAAKTIKNADLIDLSDIKAAVLEAGAQRIADALFEALES